MQNNKFLWITAAMILILTYSAYAYQCSTSSSDYIDYIDFNSGNVSDYFNATDITTPYYETNLINFSSESVWEGNASMRIQNANFDHKAVRNTYHLTDTNVSVEFFVKFDNSTLYDASGDLAFQIRDGGTPVLYCDAGKDLTNNNWWCNGNDMNVNANTNEWARIRIINNGSQYAVFYNETLMKNITISNPISRIYFYSDNAVSYIDQFMVYNRTIYGDSCPPLITEQILNISGLKYNDLEEGKQYILNNMTFSNFSYSVNTSTSNVSCNLYRNGTLSFIEQFNITTSGSYQFNLSSINYHPSTEVNYTYYLDCNRFSGANLNESIVSSVVQDVQGPRIFFAGCPSCYSGNLTFNSTPLINVSFVDLSGISLIKMTSFVSSNFSALNNSYDCVASVDNYWSCFSNVNNELNSFGNSLYFYGNDSLGNTNLVYALKYDIFLTLNLTNCSLTDSNLAINFSLFDEDALGIIYGNISGTVIAYRDNRSQGQNYTFAVYNVSNAQICLNEESNYDVYLHHKTSEGFGERYYVYNSSAGGGVVDNVFLYNFLDNTGVSTLRSIMYDNYYNFYPELIIKMQRFYPSENVWRTVQVDKSDEGGTAVFYVRQDSYDYRFIFDYYGNTLMMSIPLKFVCDTSTFCTQDFVVNQITYPKYESMTYSYTYNNVTNIISFVWDDPSNIVQGVRLFVESQKMSGTQTICDTSLEAASGTINCDITGYDGLIRVTATRHASDPQNFFTATIDKIAKALQNIMDNSNNKKMGVFFTSIIFVGIVLTGIASPFLVIILSVFALIITFSLGMISLLTFSMIIGACCIGIILSLVVKY